MHWRMCVYQSRLGTEQGRFINRIDSQGHIQSGGVHDSDVLRQLAVEGKILSNRGEHLDLKILMICNSPLKQVNDVINRLVDAAPIASVQLGVNEE